VAIWAPNSAGWIIAAFGLLTAGAVLVPISTRYKAAEAGEIIGRSGAKLLLVHPDFLGLDFSAPAGVPSIDLRSGFLGSGSPFAAPVRGDDLCDIFFTSGTTGRSKGVLMTHAQTIRAWGEWCSLVGLRPGDRYLIVSPFSHIFGYKAGCLAAMLAGATMLPAAVFDVTAVTVLTGYGLTEAGGTVTLSRRGDPPEDIARTAGLPCAGTEVRIAADGEVLVRGYRVMRGYLDDPDGTAAAVDAGGWLHTGDLGELDAGGRLRIAGRKKDVFFVGGFNVYPAEVEGYLLEHPAVAQAAVIGVPDDRLGQVGAAFVVADGPAREADLVAWCRSRMAGYKAPRSVTFVAELPLNAAGKVDKPRLEARLASA
jgi:acyl-CoA synthetase (AMP-forming)/AMP-acid ligase II